MKPPDTSNLIAAIALGVSALALIVSGLLAWRQNRLQARLTAIEEERRGEEVEARARWSDAEHSPAADWEGRPCVDQ